ncbi:hypothetical protein A9Q87_11545 [Flavobacteriales bacterium 34_180_T64]|nr:hypothetical protein A9Q87_11545 [Flavobacteriales bacterium 34_180_T64]
MKSTFQILIILLCVCNLGWSQSDSLNELEKINKFKQEELKAKAWLDSQYEWNVISEGESITYNKEAKKILSDSQYYKFIYPEEYTWATTLILLKKKVIKQAVWYMINLYGEDKIKNGSHISDALVSLDQAIDMEKVLTSSYYSYIAFDPEVVTIENGQVKEYSRPDLAEEKLSHVKEMMTYIFEYRKQKAKQ